MKRNFNTIKFKLTAWFAGLILITSLSSILILNYAVASNRGRMPLLPERTFTNGQFGQDQFGREQFIIKIQEERNAVQQRVLIASTITITVQVVFAVLSSYVVIKKLLSPLEELNQLMKEVNERVLYTKIEFEGKSEEINDLVTSFNEMMQRLEKAFENQKQFVQNVSHEIKTPLTIIKTNLEALLFDKTSSREEIDSSIKTSIQSINSLNELTEDLLLLSLLSSKPIHYKQLKIQNIVNHVVEEMRKVALTKHISIQITGESKGKLLCNAELLKRALSNIIENSIKYSPESSEISINLSDQENQILIQINDRGCGIPDIELQKVFERFYRSDNSRSRETGGSGLGLAITKEVIELIDGKISVRNLNPGLSTIIEFPAS